VQTIDTSVLDAHICSTLLHIGSQSAGFGGGIGGSGAGIGSVVTLYSVMLFQPSPHHPYPPIVSKRGFHHAVTSDRLRIPPS
jgi:hypothetical protein